MAEADDQIEQVQSQSLNEEDDYRIEEVASQGSDPERVPESPPLFTQDVEGELEPDKNNWTGQSHNYRKGSDVVIDIEYDDDDVEVDYRNPKDEFLNPGKELATTGNNPSTDEFPEEDDAFLISAAASLEEGERSSSSKKDLETNAESVEQIKEEIFFNMSQSQPMNDPKIMEEEEKRQKDVQKFNKFEALDKIFPDVRCSEYNTVAFLIKSNYKPMDPLEPNPSKCVFKWDSKFIPMPFCDENVVTIRPRNNPNSSETGDDQARPRQIRIWDRIRDTLSNFPLLSAEDIATALKRYHPKIGELKALKYCFETIMSSAERDHFFTKVIPFMTSLVLQTSDIVTCPLPILRRNVNHNISLSQKQIACLLANAFFCTFPKRFKSELDMPSINFRDLFMEEQDRETVLKTKAQKLRCLIHYFTRVEAEMPQGVVTYTRKNLRHSNMPDWSLLDKGLTKIVPLLQGTIEDDGAGLLKVDFANCFIGGGALGGGCVQEEIQFVTYPELIISRLFSEKLNSNEAIIFTGPERFSSYIGYASSFQFDGDFQDTTPYDSKGRRCTQIVAIDALFIARPSFQYNPKAITRELNKAFVGFASPTPNPVAVATGKWGCGAFNGDPQLKAIIQLLAASNAGRDVVFYTFGDLANLNDVLSIYESISTMKIKDVWNLLCQYHTICCSTGKPTRNLKDFCSQYAEGQIAQIEQELKQSTSSASTEKKLKEVPITHFYRNNDKPVAPPILDDAAVVEIMNGIHQINSPDKKLTDDRKSSAIVDSSNSTSKRPRDNGPNDDPEDSSKPSSSGTGNPVKGLKGGNPNYNSDASPTSSKKPRKSLIPDFYAK